MADHLTLPTRGLVWSDEEPGMDCIDCGANVPCDVEDDPDSDGVLITPEHACGDCGEPLCVEHGVVCKRCDPEGEDG